MKIQEIPERLNQIIEKLNSIDEALRHLPPKPEPKEYLLNNVLQLTEVAACKNF